MTTKTYDQECAEAQKIFDENFHTETPSEEEDIIGIIRCKHCDKKYTFKNNFNGVSSATALRRAQNHLDNEHNIYFMSVFMKERIGRYF